MPVTTGGATGRSKRMAGRIILLNGASSAGKSTLARALQAELQEPFWHFSIDHLWAADILPGNRIRSGEFPWSALRPDFFEGFHRCLPALADAGNNLIVDYIVESAASMQRLLALLGHLDVFFVGVHCPVAELERRELARGDRRIGEARADFEITHTFGIYDFEIQPMDSPGNGAAEVIAAWSARKRPSAFERMAVARI
jgi:chloramphenicol 3-O phosphotransferase